MDSRSADELIERLEVMPFASVEPQLAALSAATRITVTCSPRHGVDHTLRFAETWAERGLEVVPHIAARMVEDSDHLVRIAARLGAAGFAEVFVIGGDHSPPNGSYASSARLLEDLSPLVPNVSVGIAGYPEGHPEISPDALIEALLKKASRASAIVTQLCFDPAAIAAWIRSVRAAGVTLPVIVGVAGVVERTKLLELSLRVGVGVSTRYLRKNARSAVRLMRRQYDPSALVEELVRLQVAEPSLGIAGLHVFTFNQLAATEKWLHATRTRRMSDA